MMGVLNFNKLFISPMSPIGPMGFIRLIGLMQGNI